jgi:hypothetical protein
LEEMKEREWYARSGWRKELEEEEELDMVLISRVTDVAEDIVVAVAVTSAEGHNGA